MPEVSRPTTETTFEEAMGRLEELLEAMEGDQLPLDQLLENYESGVTLIQICRERLEAARFRVEQVTLARNAEGEATARTESLAVGEITREIPSPAPRPRRNSNARSSSIGEDTLL